MRLIIGITGGGFFGLLSSIVLRVVGLVGMGMGNCWCGGEVCGESLMGGLDRGRVGLYV